MMTSHEIDAMEKERAARHEAGHATVAAVEGRWIESCWLFRNDSGNPNESSWLGCMQTLGRGSACESIAGVVGELSIEDSSIVFDGSIPPESAAEEIYIYIELGIVELSSTDREGLPANRDDWFPAIVEAVELLRDHRDLFNWIVAELLSDEVVTDGEIREQIDSGSLATEE